MSFLRSHRNLASVSTLLALFAGSAGAGEELSEQRFLSVLTPDSAPIRALDEDYVAAAGARRAAGAFENPSIVFEREAFDASADQNTVKLEWRPPLDGRRGAAVGAKRARLDAAGAAREWERLKLRIEYRAIFAEWAISQAHVESVRKHFSELTALSERFRQRAARGEESGLDAKRLELAAFQVSAEVAKSEAAYAHTKSHAIGAATFAGSVLSARELQAAIPVLPMLPVPHDKHSAVEEANEHLYLDVEAQSRALEAAELEARAEGRAVAFPTIGGGLTRIKDAGDTFEGYFWGFAFELPLFDRNQGNREAASRRIEVERSRLDLLEANAHTEHAAAIAAYAALYERASRLEVTRATADEVAVASRASFLAGETSLTDLFDTLRSVLDSRLAALDLYAEALAAYRQLALLNAATIEMGETR